MAEIVLFHHACGLTDGMHVFADRLRAGGHQVTLPDLFGGTTFSVVEEGVAYVEDLGVEEIVSRGKAAVADLPSGLVYGGISLGALPAQQCGQNRPGTRAVLLYEGGVPLSFFGEDWPGGIGLQIHAKRDDAWAEVDVLQALARAVPGAELHLYPGSQHLFTDSSLDAYDAAATEAVVDRTLSWLSRLG